MIDIQHVSQIALPDTPLHRLESAPGVWIKCEHMNPTGSHKDRAYRQMIASLGDVRGKTLVDYSTGNGAISLSWIGKQLGSDVAVFMPEGMTEGRKRLVRAHGGTLVETPQAQFVQGARAAAFAFVESRPDSILVNQSENPGNARAFIDVGLSLAKQCHEMDLKPKGFVCAIGTGGCISGIAEVIRGEFGLPSIGVELPESSLIWSKRRGEIIMPGLPSIIGMGAGHIARNTHEAVIDDIQLFHGGDSIPRMQDSLRRIDGIDVGPSSIVNILIAMKLARAWNGDIITVSFDSGDRYD